MGPRSRMGTPQRFDTVWASHRLASLACTGHDPGPGRRAPMTRSARPDSTAPATVGSSAGSSEPSQSMKQTVCEEAAVRPDQQAAPKPRWGSSTTSAPMARAIPAEPSVDPLSTTMARNPAGKRESTQGSASASSRTGRTTSIMVPT